MTLEDILEGWSRNPDEAEIIEIYRQKLKETYSEKLGKDPNSKTLQGLEGYELQGIRKALEENAYMVYRGIYYRSDARNGDDALAVLDAMQKYGYLPVSTRSNGISMTVFPKVAERFAKGDTTGSGAYCASGGIVITIDIENHSYHQPYLYLVPARADRLVSEPIHRGFHARPEYVPEGEIISQDPILIGQILGITAYRKKKYPDEGYESRDFYP